MNNSYIDENGQLIYFMSYTPNSTDSSVYTEKLIELMKDKNNDIDKEKNVEELRVDEKGEMKRKIML